IAHQRPITAPVAEPLQFTQQRAAVTPTLIPMLHHDGLPRINPAVARITTHPALGKGFAAQMSADSALADAEAKADPLPRPALAMECPHLLVLRLAVRGARQPGAWLFSVSRRAGEEDCRF